MNIRKLWLNQVSEKHSGSKETENCYVEVSTQFEKVIGLTLDKIAEEWNNVTTYEEEKT